MAKRKKNKTILQSSYVYIFLCCLTNKMDDCLGNMSEIITTPSDSQT